MIRGRLSRTGTALALALLAAVLLTIMHVLVRRTSAALPPFEIAFFRSLFGLAAVTPLVMRVGWSAFRTAQPRLQILRGITGAGAMLSWFWGLSVVPIAEATALSFTSAIFASVGAVFFLGERMGVRRWSAVVIGFAGALVILRPGIEVIQAGSLAVLFSALCWGSGIVIVKRIARTDSAVTIVAVMGVMMTLATFVPAAFVWVWPSGGQLPWLALIGALGTAGTLAFTQSLRLADASVVVPVDFTRLVWAAAFGYLFFAEIPDGWTWAGGAIIVSSTAYIGLREARLRRLADNAA